MNREPGGEIVELALGHNDMNAQTLVDRLATEGIRSELVTRHDQYVGLDHSSGHRLLLEADDLAAARPIIADHLGDPSLFEPAVVEQVDLWDQLKLPLMTLVVLAVLVLVLYLAGTR